MVSMRNQKLWQLSLSLPPEHADAFSDQLGDTACALSVLIPPRTATAQIEALFDHPPDKAALTAQVTVMAMLAGIKAPAVTIEEVPSLDWLEKVAADFPPLPIARWTVHGAHYRKDVPNRRGALQIDATSAFGTGEHPTTRGCLLMLDWVLKQKYRPQHMLDIGCGSGILAMGFAKATHGTAVAVDLDPDSVEVARNNLRVNGLQHLVRLGISRGTSAALVKNGKPYDLIIANIFAGPLSHMAWNVRNHLRPGGMIILSGILNHQANRVLAAYRMQKLYLLKQLRIGEWSVLALVRRNRVAG